nr:P2X purinoceptor 4 isoform X3 [Macaca nemestrina]
MPPRGSQFQTGRWRPPLGPGPRPPGAASFRALPMMTALRAGRADWAGLRAGTGTQTGSGTGSRRCGHGGLLRRAGGLPVRVRHAAHRAHPQPQSGAHEPRRAAAHPGLRHRQENSLFVMTNMILTMNQTQDLCPEIPDVTTVCKSDANCTAGSAGTHSNGVSTGRCVPFNRSVKTCEVAAWCPVEDDTHVPQPAFLKAAENFTLLVKNNIWYPKFNFSKRNILPNITTTYLKSCIYDAKTDPFCPIFRLGKIVENAGHSFQDMAVEGGIMGIQVNWDCNLDRAASLCLPRYSFRRLDTRDVEHNVSPGYNFRFAKYYRDPAGKEQRTLLKAYGIRFDIIVFGKAGKFDIIPTMINIGSGLALLGMATVLCDIIVLYCMKKRLYYREKKYKYVEDYEQGLASELDP